MNLLFKEQIWKAQFRPTEASALFEEKLRSVFGLQYRYESARLLIGRSLADPSRPTPLTSKTKFYSKPIPGEQLFNDNDDLWLCTLILDGNFKLDLTIEEFRRLVEDHWARGYELIKDELETCQGNEIKLIQRLSDLLPESIRSNIQAPFPGGVEGEIQISVGPISKSLSKNETIDFTINAPSVPPHIALMGAIGKGKTLTGSFIAIELSKKSGIPFLFIDPKGEFVKDGRVVGPFAELGNQINGIEVGTDPIPIDFLPSPDSPSQKIARAAMRLRDTLILCCKSPGDLQRDLLRTAIEEVIKSYENRSLRSVRDQYEHSLRANGKDPIDSIVSRLNELTNDKMLCFEPLVQPSHFFSKSWVISLRLLPEELKRLVMLLLLDSISTFILEQPDSEVNKGFRVLRHLLVVDEARKTLRERRSESLVDLIRQGRSKGSVVMLLSQDPSDFEGEKDDFTSQLGTVIAFACNQNKKGLSALEGVFGRKLQPAEFSDTYLEAGVAFVKIPGREPERVRCWQPVGGPK